MSTKAILILAAVGAALYFLSKGRSGGVTTSQPAGGGAVAQVEP